MQRGTVKVFHEDKGFGFIKTDYPGPDYFFHRSALMVRGPKTIGAGARVEFDVEVSERGERAINVRRVA
jgi:CspA family cold shock protein